MKKSRRKIVLLCLVAMMSAMAFTLAAPALPGGHGVALAADGGADAGFHQAWIKMTDLVKGWLGTLVAGLIFIWGIFRFLGQSKIEGLLAIVVAITIKFLPQIIEGIFL